MPGPTRSRAAARHPAAIIALAAPLCALLALGCGAPTAPATGPEAGVYALTRVGGRPLPALSDSAGADDFGYVLADTIALDGRGHALRVRLLERVDAHGDLTYASRIAQSYRITGDSIVIDLTGLCPLGALCVRPDRGTIADGHITTNAYTAGPALFVRVGARGVQWPPD